MIRILIVDDSIIMRKQIKNIAEELKYKIVGAAKNGEEGISMYQQTQPDIVTMDISMPIVNGIDATRRIVYDNKGAKVLMLTSHGQEKMVVEAIKVGASGYLLKPITHDTFKTAVENILDKDKIDKIDDDDTLLCETDNL